MVKIKKTPAFTISLMLSIAALNAEESQPWWKSSKSKTPKEVAPKLEKKPLPKAPYVSKEQKTPWWKQPYKKQEQEKQLEVAKSITPKTEKSELATSQAPKPQKEKKSFWGELFKSRKDSKKAEQKENLAEDKIVEPTIATKEKKARKTPDFSFFKNLFKRPAKQAEPENDHVVVAQDKEIDKTEAKVTPAPKPQKQVAEKAPAKVKKSEPKEIKTTVTIIPKKAETESEEKEPTNAFTQFFKNIFKKSDSATKLSSQKRIKRLGKENEGYYVPSVSQKLRRKGRSYHQFNT